jgi:glycosyltransferase involved in cell wall biosynthesis
VGHDRRWDRRGPRALSSGTVRVVRVIARLNVGGPSIQAITLTRRLEPLGYATTLVRGQEDEREGSMDYLARELRVHPVLVPSLRRNPGWRDLRALISLVAIICREQPQIVHTHAAKAGTLGRCASLVAAFLNRRRPVLVHTFHGHSLSGYFSPRAAAVYLGIERRLARRTDRLIAVSEQVRDELVALGVAPHERFEVIPLGFDLSRFTVDGEPRRAARAAVRAELGLSPDATVVTLVARLVPIKRVDRFLEIAAHLSSVPDIHFLIVGDGECHEALISTPTAERLAPRLTWTGFTERIEDVYFASDIVALTSDNEGTPVSLIEAQAAAVPVVSTDVGGVGAVVSHGVSGFLVNPSDTRAFADAVAELVDDPALARRFGLTGRERVQSAFGLDRLVTDLDLLYHRLLADRRGPDAVSVVIPVWGAYADHRLDEAIASIRAQNVATSIILVDNGNQPPLQLPGVSIVRSRTQISVGAARDLGLRSVSTPRVMFWDADDVMLPGTLRRLADRLDKDPWLVACSTSIIDGDTGRRLHWPRRWPLRLSQLHTLWATLNAVSSLYPVTGALLRTGLAQAAGFPDAERGEDWVMGVSLGFRGRVDVDEHPGRLYRRGPASLSAGWTRRDVLANARLVRERLRTDPAVPAPVARLAPMILLGQHAVLQVLRPLARRTPGRRRSGV